MAVKLSEYMPYKRSNEIVTPIITDDPEYQEVCRLTVEQVPNGEYQLIASWVFSLPDINDAMLWRFVIDGDVGIDFRAENKDVNDRKGWSYTTDKEITTNGLEIILEARVQNGGADATIEFVYLSAERKPLS